MKEVVANLAGQPANLRASYAYDDVGNREGQTQPNGSTVTYQYDRRNRLQNLAHRTAAGVLMLGLAYTVDASGLRTQIAETGATPANNRTTVYQYDPLKRLTHSTVTAATTAQNLAEVFTYDKVGNRITRTCTGQQRTCTGGATTNTAVVTVNTTNTYDNNDRLTREQWTGPAATYDFAYDDAGNLRTKKQSTTTLADYTWDVENRLTEATLTPTGPGGTRTTTRYRYDPNGIRRSSEVVVQTNTGSPTNTKTRTNFLIDLNQAYAQVLEDWTATATQPGTTEPTLPDASLQNSYVFGDDLIAEARYASLPTGQPGANAPGEGGNDPTARIGASTGNSALHYDGLGTTRLLSAVNVDANGAPLAGNETLTDTYAYSAFGESDLASTTGTTQNNYRYTGEQLDPNVGFYYLRARLMNPVQGRFVSQDAWAGTDAMPQTLHKYLYAHGNPVIYVDPTGRYTADFGRAVEDEVCEQYVGTMPTGPATECGDVAYYSWERYFKPDIMDWGLRKFNEVKPASPSGVAKGIVQIAAYTAAYGGEPFGFTPNTVWVPMPAIVDDRWVYFANVEGIIFYTDDETMRRALAEASLATVSAITYRTLRYAGTRIGADAGARALFNRGIIAIGAQAARLNAQLNLAPLLRF